MTSTVRRAGRGEPVVLLHPLALSGAVWGEFATRLVAAGFDVVAPDARGHGAEPAPWDGAPFSIADLADDVATLLDDLGVDRAHVVGMSMGGSIAVELAARHPGRVDRLVLADTTAWYGPNAPAAWTERAARAVGVPRRRQIPFQTDRWFTDEFVRTAHDEVRRVAAVFTATDSLAHAAACRALGALDARERLASIPAPTLVLTGEEDLATPPSMGRALADGIPGSRFELLPALRHMSLVERPALAAVVAAHLRGVAAPDLSDVDCGCAAHAEEVVV